MCNSDTKEKINGWYLYNLRLQVQMENSFTKETENLVESIPLLPTWMAYTSSASAIRCPPWRPKSSCLPLTLERPPRVMAWRQKVGRHLEDKTIKLRFAKLKAFSCGCIFGLRTSLSLFLFSKQFSFVFLVLYKSPHSHSVPSSGGGDTWDGRWTELHGIRDRFLAFWMVFPKCRPLYWWTWLTKCSSRV